MDINTFTNNLNELSLRGIRHEPLAQRIELWDTYTGMPDMLGLIQIHEKAYEHSPGSNRENVWMYSLASEDPRVYPLKNILIFGDCRDKAGVYTKGVRCNILDWDVVVPTEKSKSDKVNVLKVYGTEPIIGLDIVYDRYYVFNRYNLDPHASDLEMLDVPFGAIPVNYDIRTETNYGWTDHSGYMRRCVTSIYRNNELFYTIPGNPQYGIPKALTIISELDGKAFDHISINFESDLIGRKVFWRDQPGVITGYCKGKACVIIEPDGIEKFKAPGNMNKEDADIFENGDDFVKVELWSNDIWWFREEL